MYKNIIYSIFILSTLFFTPHIYAQSFSVSVTPQLQEIISKRNNTIILPYTVTNLGDPQVITLKIYKLQVKDSAGTYELTPYDPSKDSILFQIQDSSIQLDSPFLMKSKNTFSFKVGMNIPAEAIEGDYYFSLVAEAETQKGFGNASNILVQGGIGSHMLLTVSDSAEIEQRGSIVQYEILSDRIIKLKDKKIVIFDSYEDIPVLLSAANKGKNFVRTSGSITLLPYFFKGKPQTDIDIPKENPDESTSYTVVPQYLLTGSQGILKTSVNPVCDTSHKPVCKQPHTVVLHAPFSGMYRLSAVVSFGENAQIAYGDVVFVVFPFKIITFFIFSFILIIILGRMVQKRYKTRIA